jgi:hypothetical protein
MKLRAICILALACLAIAPVSAGERPSLLRGGTTSPNFLGATGLLFIPSAYTVGDRGVAGHAYFTDDFRTYGGLVGPIDRLEVGASYFDADGFGDDGVLLNGKFMLLKENAFLPGVSVGVIDALDELNADPSWYAVASKALPRFLPVVGGFTVHAGFGGGIYDEELFAGVEWQIGTPLDAIPLTRPTVAAMAEFMNGDFNVGLRGRYRGFAATLGVFDFDNFGGGISYTTGLRLW